MLHCENTFMNDDEPEEDIVDTFAEQFFGVARYV